MVSGAIFSAIMAVPVGEGGSQDSSSSTGVAAGLGEGPGAVNLVATNTAHPPAAGTALGPVISRWSRSAIVFDPSSAVTMSVVRTARLPRPVNLFAATPFPPQTAPLGTARLPITARLVTGLAN